MSHDAPAPTAPRPPSELRDVLIIGGGPAGLTAALYAARANLRPLVIAGYEAGGQLMITTDVENYPGFPSGVQGPELMDLFRKQAARFGTEFVDKNVTAVNFKSRPLEITVEDVTYKAKTVIVATGASAKWLGLANESRLRGRGVSACATCDGFFFRGKHVVVVGGGDTAMEETNFLTRFASKVTLVHRRDEFRASKIMQDRVLSNPKVEVVWDTEVVDVLGPETVTGVKLRNVKTGATRDLACDGFFLAIGHKPNTDLFEGQLAIEPNGYLKVVGPHETYSSVPGVFIAGDVFDHRYRQAITAAGSGCKAAIDAERWLEARGEAVMNTEVNW